MHQANKDAAQPSILTVAQAAHAIDQRLRECPRRAFHVRISIVTITKNDADGLQRTVNSVLNQRTPPWQWILVDGGSCPDSLQLAMELDKAGQLHQLIREPDSGPYAAMAKGAALATADYVCFLNDGDAFASADTLQRVEILLEEHRPDVLLGWGQLGSGIQASWLTRLPAMRMASLGFCHQAATSALPAKPTTTPSSWRS
jgi:hypothetical protein